MKLILFVLFTFLVNCIFSQKFKVLPYTINEGLSSYNAYQSIQDNNGFIWVTTQDGLNLFDGKSIKIFNTTSSPALSGNNCAALFYDKKNDNLWIASHNGGVDILNTVTREIISHLPIQKIYNNIGNANINFIQKLEDIKFIIGFTLGYLIITTDDNGRILSEKYFRNNRNIKYFLEFEHKRYLLFENNVLAELNSKNEINNIINENGNDNVLSCSKIENHYYIQANNGLYKVSDEGVFSQITLRHIKEIRSICEVNNKLLVATEKGIFYTNSNFDSIVALNYLIMDKYKDWQYNIFNINYLSSGQIIYTGSKGMFIQSSEPTAFSNVKFENLKTKTAPHIHKIYKKNDSNFIFYNNGGIINYNEVKSEYSIINEDKYYYSQFSTPSGANFVSINSGTFLKNSNFSKNIGSIYKELVPLNFESIYKTLDLNDSLIIFCIANQHGFGVWNIKSREFSYADKYFNIDQLGFGNDFYKIDNYKMLVVTNNSLYQFDFTNRTCKQLIIKKNETANFSLLMSVKIIANKIWISSYGNGVIILNKNFSINNIINEKNGLSNNSTYEIVDDSSGVWVSTNKGLNKINKQNFKVINYYEENGLHANTFEEECAFVDNKRILFGGPGGVTIINTNQLVNLSKPGKCYFEELTTDNGTELNTTCILNNKSIDISNNIFVVKLKIISIDLEHGKNLQYEYRLKSINNAWVKLGTNNEIILTGLSPKEYSIEVKAVNQDGQESEINTLTLIFLPKWYQTWWFKTLIVLSIIGIAYLLYKMRIAQIIKEQKIKNALASDLHDELGSSLTGLKVYAYQAKKNPEYMQSLEEGISQSIKSVREMIWQLNEEKLTVYDLINKLAIIYKPLLKINNINLNMHVATEISSVELNQKEKSHLYLILKEIINNAMKYAQASELNIDVAKGKTRLRFSIADNGIGIQNENKGYGLKNIEARAKEIKYSINRQSNSGGTIYLIEK